MDLELLIRQGIQKAFAEKFNHQISLDELSVKPTSREYDGSHTFVLFPYLKITRRKPEESAEIIGNYLIENTGVITGFNAIKGYLNLTVSDNAWIKMFNSSITDRNRGKFLPNGKKVIVEYSSPNTNKPLHLGHMRNIFLGYSVAAILEASGCEVLRVNLVNDRGIHICKSMLSYEKFGNDETPESSGTKGDHLIGKYYVLFDREYKKQVEELVRNGMDRETAEKNASLIREAQEMLRKWEEKDQHVTSLWKKMNEWVYQGFEETYKRMGVAFQRTYYESETYLLGKEIVREGLDKGILYKKEDGSVWIDLRDEGLDEKLLLRSDGTSVYITQDLGTCDIRYRDFPFDLSIYVVGNEQNYHFDILFRILKKLRRPYASGLVHLSYGMVDLPSGKMKSREGTVVDADDLMDEMYDTAVKHTEELGKIEDFSPSQLSELYQMIGMGALKYFILKVDPKKRMLFNPEESVQFHGNTGPFIEYTHARISSILRKAVEMKISIPDQIDPSMPLHETERALLILLYDFPAKLKEAADEFSPSVIANYCYELAREYNRFYTELSVLSEPDQVKRDFRIVLSAHLAKTIKSGMGLLGIQVPERM
ncbi:MAG TPA: arginine--tRNA ligase [Cyclobacteriaceae bacterium]|nr:arginine--tRNA ligase [Cyclobacteriaceae bacterium]